MECAAAGDGRSSLVARSSPVEPPLNLLATRAPLFPALLSADRRKGGCRIPAARGAALRTTSGKNASHVRCGFSLSACAALQQWVLSVLHSR